MADTYYLIVESGSYTVHGKPYGPGIHELKGDDAQKTAQAAQNSGLDFVLVTTERPSEANVAKTVIELLQKQNPTAGLPVTRQQVNQSHYESLSHQLADEVGGTGGDVTEGIMLTEEVIGAAGGQPDTGPKGAFVPKTATGSVLSSADLAGARGARREAEAQVQSPLDLPHGGGTFGSDLDESALREGNPDKGNPDKGKAPGASAKDDGDDPTSALDAIPRKQLVEEATRRGLSTRGSKADIAFRIAEDEGRDGDSKDAGSDDPGGDADDKDAAKPDDDNDK